MPERKAIDNDTGGSRFRTRVSSPEGKQCRSSVATMETLKSHDAVRGIIEEDGALLVSFWSHDGYFRVLDSANKAALTERILKALRDKEEISFTFDKELNILEIS